MIADTASTRSATWSAVPHVTRRSLTSAGASTPVASAVRSRRSSTSTSAVPHRPREPRPQAGGLEVGQQRGEPVGTERRGRRGHGTVDADDRGERREQLRPVEEDVLGPGSDGRAVEVDETNVVSDNRDRLGVDPMVGDAGVAERDDGTPGACEERVVDLVGRKRGQGSRSVVKHEHGVARRGLGGDDDVARRHTRALRQERDERLVLDGLEPAPA